MCGIQTALTWSLAVLVFGNCYTCNRIMCVFLPFLDALIEINTDESGTFNCQMHTLLGVSKILRTKTVQDEK